MQKSLPPLLYKYRAPLLSADFDRINNMIIKGEYFCSSPKSFNDVFDLKPVLSFECTDNDYINGYIRIARKKGDQRLRHDLIKEVRSYIGTDNDPRSEVFREKRQKQLDGFSEELGVFCLAGSGDNILMWAHYANSYSGICLEISTEKFEYLQDVTYQDDRPVILWQEPIKPSDLAKKRGYTKSSHWAYEDEWRAFGTVNKNLQMGAGTVKRIIFGPNCAASTIERIKDIIARSGQRIGIANAVPDAKKFKINLIDI